MPFKYTYDEILAMVRRTVLDVRIARAIARRAGLRPGGAGAGHTTIWSVCALADGGAFQEEFDLIPWAFFPPNYQQYIGQWDVSPASEVQISVVVDEATTSGAHIIAVWATSAEELITLAGFPPEEWNYLASPVSPSSSGFYVTEWEPLPQEAIDTGEIAVAVMVAADNTMDVLQFGLAEIHLR